MLDTLVEALDEELYTGAVAYDERPPHFTPTPIDERLPRTATFVPANLRHYYRYDLDSKTFTRIDGLDDNDVLRSGLDHHVERDTRDPHFYMRTTILTSGSKLTPAALRESHAS